MQVRKYGESGTEVSELFPHVGEVVDDICAIRSMYTDIPNHEPSILLLNTGHIQPGRPSLGAWLTYRLGFDNEDLPGYVVLCPDQPTVVGPPLWSNGFLPAVHQGTFISDRMPERAKDFDPKKLIPYIDKKDATLIEQRRQLDLLEKLNRMHLERHIKQDSQLDGAIQAMETAYRMQTEAPKVFDISKRDRSNPETLWPWQHRTRMSDGGPAHREGRQDGAGLLCEGGSLGRPLRHLRASKKRQGFGSALCGGRQGPEVTRTLRRDPRRLRHGVRTYAGARDRWRRRWRQGHQRPGPLMFLEPWRASVVVAKDPLAT